MVSGNLSALLSHPQLWRARHGLPSSPAGEPLSTGFSELDTRLAEKGWPRTGLVELLCLEPGMGELRLLAPALCALSRTSPRWIVWIDPPHIPYAPALARLGFALDRLLLIRPDAHSDALWSAEQALRSGACSAVLSWLDQQGRLKTQDVRRLKLAARQGRSLAVLFRPESARLHASMADLRMTLSNGPAADHLRITLLKHRGGWPAEPFTLALASVPELAVRRRGRTELLDTLAQWRSSRCMPVIPPAPEDTLPVADPGPIPRRRHTLHSTHSSARNIAPERSRTRFPLLAS